jgi:hypothetical protein
VQSDFVPTDRSALLTPEDRRALARDLAALDWLPREADA